MAGRWFVFVALLLTPAIADAAAYTSAADGNWSDDATWSGSGVPGNGDTVTIGTGHTITVDVNTTVGDSPGTAANVITATTTGALTVATGVTFTIKGCVQMEDGNWTMAAGSIVEFQVPSAVRYWFRTAKAHSDTCKIVINGTSGNRCSFRSSSGAGIAYIDANGFIGASLIQAEYCDFTRIGDATERFAEPYCNSSGLDFYLRYCTLTSCGELTTSTNINTNASFELLNCTWATTVSTNTINVATAANAAGGKTRSIIGCTFDKVAVFVVQGWTVTNNYFNEGLSGTAGTGAWISFQDNFICKSTQPGIIAHGDVTNCYFYKKTVDNPHFLGTSASRANTFTGNIFEHGGTQANGDCMPLQNPSSAFTYTFTNNIVLPNSAGNNSGTLFSALGGANVTFNAEHNTYFNNATGSGGAIAETYTGHSGMLASFRSNLAWSPTSTTAYLLQDSGTDDAAAGYVTNCGYNGIWNPRATRYDVLAGVITNDLTANDVSGDPQFVDSTRDLASWDASLGGAGTETAALARIAADPYLTDDLVTWVKAGFVVRNSAFNNAGHDGVTIGAMGYTPASVVSPLSASIPGSGLDPLYRGPVQ